MQFTYPAPPKYRNFAHRLISGLNSSKYGTTLFVPNFESFYREKQNKLSLGIKRTESHRLQNNRFFYLLNHRNRRKRVSLFTIALDFMFLNREGSFPARIVDHQLLNTRSVLQKDGSGLQIIKSEFVTGGSQEKVIALKES